MRHLPIVLCCLATIAAPGAPVPKGKGGFEAKEWKKADPGKDCKFSFDAREGSVTFKVPPTRRYRGLATGRLNAPHLVRPAGDGDFDARVRVRASFDPGTTRAGFGHALGALFVVDSAKGGGDFSRVFIADFGGVDDGEGPVPRAEAQGAGPPRGAAWAKHVDRPPHRVVKVGGKVEWETHLKVTRRGEALRAYLSADGKKWSGPYGRLPDSSARDTGFDGKFSGELRVGVGVLSISDRETVVTFDRFKFTPVKAKGK